MAVINSGAFNDGSGNRYFQFYYTTSKYSQGITKVDWSFKSCYSGGTSGRSIYCDCTLSASIGSGSLYSGNLPSYSQGWTYTSFNNGASYAGGASHYVNKSGTFYIKHNTSGNASINIYIDANIYYTTGNQDGSGTISLTGNPPYTNVTKPTSVTVNTSIAKPGDTITVSWSGASAGTNNPISSYYVAASYDAYPSSGATVVLSKTVTTSSGSGSATFTVPNNRGKKLQFEVQARGSYNNTTLTESPKAICIINSLPAAPKVSTNKNVIPSTGGTVNFTVTAGTDAQSSQTKTLYYSTSVTGTKTVFTSPLSKNLTAAATYYFWTYDGLEYSSSYTSKTISKNTKPTVSIDSTNNISSEYNNISYISNLKLNGSSNKTVTYKWTLNNNNIITPISNTQNIDIKPWDYGVKPGDSYYLKLEVDDGIETSYLTTISYSIPATASISNSYNQIANSNIINTNGDFYDNIRALLPIDTYHINAKTVNITTNYGIINYNKNTGYCDITSLASLEKEKEYEFNISINADGLERTYTFKKKKTPSFDGGILTSSSNIINVFKPNNIIFNIKSPDGFVNNQNYNFYNYNLGNSTTSNNYSAFKIKFRYDNKEAEQALSDAGVFKIDSSTTNDTIFFNLSSTVWNSIIDTLGVTDLLNNVNIQVILEITNLFGATSNYTGALTLNMKGDISLSNFITKINGVTLSSTSTSIREGQTLTWSYDFSTYNKQKITSEIYIYRGESSEVPNSSDNWVLYSTLTQEINNTRNTNKLINQNISQTFKIKEINESKYIFFKVKVIDYFGQIIESAVYSAGISNRHIPARITITESKYNKEDNKIYIKYKIDDNGGKLINNTDNLNTSLSNSISIVKTDSSELGTLGTPSSNILNPNNTTIQSITVPITNFTSPVLNLNLIIKTRLILDDTDTTYDKTTTIPLLIYNANPTVALRSNYLGINTKDFTIEEGKGVVIISPSSNRDKVIFQGASGNVIIDIEEQTITGIIIDGGTW